MKVWLVHIQDGRESEVLTVPYREAGIPLDRLPPKYVGKWISLTVTGPHDVPAPEWWPRQLSS